MSPAWQWRFGFVMGVGGVVEGFTTPGWEGWAFGTVGCLLIILACVLKVQEGRQHGGT